MHRTPLLLWRGEGSSPQGTLLPPRSTLLLGSSTPLPLLELSPPTSSSIGERGALYYCYTSERAVKKKKNIGTTLK